jgi:hypothetical protein
MEGSVFVSFHQGLRVTLLHVESYELVYIQQKKTKVLLFVPGTNYKLSRLCFPFSLLI